MRGVTGFRVGEGMEAAGLDLNKGDRVVLDCDDVDLSVKRTDIASQDGIAASLDVPGGLVFTPAAQGLSGRRHGGYSPFHVLPPRTVAGAFRNK